MNRASLNPKEALCDACGWQGIPTARTLRYLIGPSYLILCVMAGFAEMAGYIDTKKALTEPVAVSILHRSFWHAPGPEKHRTLSEVQKPQAPTGAARFGIANG